MTKRKHEAIEALDKELNEPSEVWDSVTAVMSVYQNKFQGFQDALKAREDAVATREQAQARLDAKAASQPSKRVVLNVGGVRSETTRELLATYKDTFFYNLLHSSTWKPDDNGEYFIDRSPEFMDFILDWYRTGRVFGVEALPAGKKEKLLCELDFYQLTDLIEVVKAEKNSPCVLQEHVRAVHTWVNQIAPGFLKCPSCDVVRPSVAKTSKEEYSRHNTFTFGGVSSCRTKTDLTCWDCGSAMGYIKPKK
eukprot:TRINITY_DN115987_c0_g1_i1.p1 TRINITY_DN115987_c0_g1~~TRINITY_DN115987_c0_g1_i1.p1  ORF type:complete len:272 (+),score=20.67 TRINITY_DN115987_c0_g1_i1:64-816(+)